MIYSQYTDFFGEIGGAPVGLLVNSITGAVDLIAGTIYRAWAQHSAPETFSESVRSRFLQRGHFYTGTAVLEQQFLASVSAALHEKAVAEATNAFWIIPTYRCNLRCAYCFQDHALHEGGTPATRDMTSADAIDLVDLLDQYGGIGRRPERPRYITLFGGEPLMRSVGETVRTLVDRARKKGYKISAVTNGVELEHFADVLGPDLIRWVQITLDGVQRSHEKRRSSCGAPSFEAIVRGIDLALSQGVKVSLRTNVDRKLLDELAGMDEWVKARGWTAFKNFRWYTSGVEVHNNPSLKKVAATTADLVSNWSGLRTIAARPPYVGKHAATLRKLRQRGISERIETSACGAHTGMMFFDPLGDVYACAEQAGQVEFAVGNWRNHTLGPSALPWASRHVGASPICSRCSNAFFCGGGCANAAMQNGGDFFGPRCNGIKDAIDFASRDFARNLLSDAVIARELEAHGSFSVNDDSIVLSSESVDIFVARASCAPL
ncbi:radical SAM/SPASM domain-containing protein [Rhizobium leguminosarum]|uniref:Radical SAM protein n=1 Tax=Rhizobium leguminosarum TaxID=384 RepID=A0A7K3VW16_RHILE|nr:radical SAM protein [Rhizobium leguminosarum]NEK20351.1 radical SAM protein [Rhizobium leguminosarum]